MASELDNPNNGLNKTVQTVIILSIALIALYFFVQLIWKILIGIFAILVVVILIMNRKILIWLYNELKKLYQKSAVLGIGAILLAILASPVLILYLFVKSLIDFRKSDLGQSMFNRNKDDDNDDEEEEDTTDDKDDVIIDITSEEVEEEPEQPKKPKKLPTQKPPQPDKNFDDESPLF